MPKIILYIATSIDGYIAKTDDNLDWLTSVPLPTEGDYGYTNLLQRIDTALMGRKTYDEIIGMDMEWPYDNLKCYVFSNDHKVPPSTPQTSIVNGFIPEIIDKIKTQSQKDIWLIGGGQLVAEFLVHHLIDEMIITIVPTLLGNGKPLFPSIGNESKWILVKSESFNTGLVTLTYHKSES